MEENKDYNRHQQSQQKFYFNEEGKLVVESNKGVWVDGEQHVKMYGNFSCNARTMGMIIHKLKGIPVAVGAKETVRHSHDDVVDSILHVYDHTIEHYCILGVDEDAVNKYVEKLAIDKYTSEKIEIEKTKAQQEVDHYKSQIETYRKAYITLREKVIKYNSIPWYKRMFKKIEI